MTTEEQRLRAAITAAPDDEAAKLAFEQHLAAHRPDAVELELLRRERELVDRRDEPAAFAALLAEYETFRLEQSDWFWDRRGNDAWFRRLDVLLTSFAAVRRPAVEKALEMRCGWAGPGLELPFAVARRCGVRQAWREREALLDLIARYRGPSGDEPAVHEGECVITMRRSE